MSKLIQMKTQHDKNYAIIALRALEDSRLSWKAKALHMYLISRPSGWAVNMNDLINRATDGRDSVEAAKKELVKYRYLSITQTRGERNQITGTIWTVYEIPSDELESTENTPEPALPDTVSPDTALPDTENPHHNKKQYTNYQGNKKQSKSPAKAGKRERKYSSESRTVTNYLSDKLKAQGAKSFNQRWAFAGFTIADRLLSDYSVMELKQAIDFLIAHPLYGQHVRAMSDIERNLMVWVRSQNDVQAIPAVSGSKASDERSVEELMFEMDQMAQGAI